MRLKGTRVMEVMEDKMLSNMGMCYESQQRENIIIVQIVLTFFIQANCVMNDS